ncbi:hypothetical protein [Bradyrhizobium stylosanthis]|uniref:Uncharacterized protein n=1 Tax=Bradyrhizobium stylosanthis TaxID=1803665 RepID=A0A560D643_9BRAD|nr:hypothetical protein [Bradyrhizobium stylosanthis]TWA92553.1 hypothetical protein FBZ96_11023 [Bradyrhizobium stylosanthis]
MKHVEDRSYADPEAAARKLVEIAAATPAVQDGRIYIERINAPFVALLKGSRGHPEFGAGIRYAVGQGWLELHESGTYVRLLQPSETL